MPVKYNKKLSYDEFREKALAQFSNLVIVKRAKEIGREAFLKEAYILYLNM